MPTKRVRRARPQVFQVDEATLTHLRKGDCFLAGPGRGCACGLRRADGSEDVETTNRLRKEMHAH